MKQLLILFSKLFLYFDGNPGKGICLFWEEGSNFINSLLSIFTIKVESKISISFSDKKFLLNFSFIPANIGVILSTNL